jgi:hypothetical protein
MLNGVCSEHFKGCCSCGMPVSSISIAHLADATSGACTCYQPWGGPTCGLLMQGTIDAVQGYGMQPNLTSWGGNVVFFEGLYHLYVAEMVNVSAS